MKKLIYSLMATLLVINIYATDPPQRQKIYPITKQSMSLEWYEEQMGLWEKEVETNPTDADAWLNLYTATRYTKIFGGEKTQKDLDNIVNECQKNIPNSFEYHHIAYWNADFFQKREMFNHLEKAYEIAPNRPETYVGFLTYNLLKRDKQKMKEFSKLWFNSNDMSAGLYAWGYNLLMSCDENGIVITQGDNDTYPAVVLQNAKNIRADVEVLNIYLLGVKDYQDKVFNALNIPLMTKGYDDFENDIAYNQAICTHIQKHSSRPFYYAVSLSPKNYENVKDEIYVVGLAYKYAEHSFDNVAVLKKNYEKHFLKDYLTIRFQNDISQGIIDNQSGSYLMPLLTLYNHYSESEEDLNKEAVEELVNKIADKTGQTENVNQIMNPNADNVVSAVITDPRDVLWGIIKVNDTLRVSQREVENYMYDKFLLDLLKQQRYKDLEIAKHEKVDWKSLLLPQYKDLTYDEYFEHGKPSDNAFPVCNVAYEGAVLYCEWLTNIYNKLDHKKKQFKKVLFRLPTEKEWEYLARKGREDAGNVNYPWGGKKYKVKGVEKIMKDTIVNEKGCYLANVKDNPASSYKKQEDTKTCLANDGGIFPVLSSSYNPSDAGLYCIIGNLAEMTSTKGIAKGGGWNTSVEDAKISKVQKYEGPGPNVGFRVVMIVLEK